MPRLPRGSRGENRHNPLHVQIAQDQYGLSAPPPPKANSDQGSDIEDHHEASIDPRTSSKILSLARKQQDEEEGSPSSTKTSNARPLMTRGPHASLLKKSNRHADEEDDEEFMGQETEFDAEEVYEELVRRPLGCTTRKS